MCKTLSGSISNLLRLKQPVKRGSYDLASVKPLLGYPTAFASHRRTPGIRKAAKAFHRPVK
jgi:hypothetical protein